MAQSEIVEVDFLTLVHEIVIEYEGDYQQLEKLIGALLLARVMVRMPVSIRRRFLCRSNQAQGVLL